MKVRLKGDIPEIFRQIYGLRENDVLTVHTIRNTVKLGGTEKEYLVTSQFIVGATWIPSRFCKEINKRNLPDWF